MHLALAKRRPRLSVETEHFLALDFAQKALQAILGRHEMGRALVPKDCKLHQFLVRNCGARRGWVGIVVSQIR